MEERFVDTLGVQLAGSVDANGEDPRSSTCAASGRRSPRARWWAQGSRPPPRFATLANGTAGHALEFDDIAAFSGHYANPVTAATLAVGEKLGVSGRDLIVAWMVGWEVIWQTAKPMHGPGGPKLLLDAAGSTRASSP